MASYADIFKRKEMKYLISAGQRAAIEAGCWSMMEVDGYGCSRVTSLYYDTPEHLLIERSLDKPLYKEKLRVRWYGAIGDDGFPQPQAQVFVELKKKFKGIVYKRRLSCSFAAARAFLGGEGYLSALNAYPMADVVAQEEAYTPRSLQIASEIEAFKARYGDLQPSMLITCQRTALTPRLFSGEVHNDSVQDDVRLTFDEAISFRDVAAGSDRWHSIIEAGEAVMEIKVAGPYPAWLLGAVSQAQARPSSFSKYGKAYTQVQMEARNREEVAASLASSAQLSQVAGRVCQARAKAISHKSSLSQLWKTWFHGTGITKEKHYV